MNAKEGFVLFVAAINRHDIEGLAALMVSDHMFVDGLGNCSVGAETMKAGWAGYFAMCPDFWVRANHVVAEGDLVLAAGEVGGSIDGVVWRTPAAWKAMIREDKVSEWRVFADNKPVYEILARR
jgi:ketosteroid isomerase-like protein